MLYIGICDDDRHFLDYIENKIEEILKNKYHIFRYRHAQNRWSRSS